MLCRIVDHPDESLGEPMGLSTKWIGLITKWVELAVAIVALVTAIVSLCTSARNSAELAAQKKRIAHLERCPVEVVIDEPKDGDHVSPEVNVSGLCSIHETCRYAFVIVRGTVAPANYWKVSGLFQVNKDGKWKGKVLLDHIPTGEEVAIEARVTDNPKAYVVGQRLSLPPEKGAPSNIVHVRRVQ